MEVYSITFCKDSLYFSETAPLQANSDLMYASYMYASHVLSVNSIFDVEGSVGRWKDWKSKSFDAGRPWRIEW